MSVMSRKELSRLPLVHESGHRLGSGKWGDGKRHGVSPSGDVCSGGRLGVRRMMRMTCPSLSVTVSQYETSSSSSGGKGGRRKLVSIGLFLSGFLLSLGE